MILNWIYTKRSLYLWS